LSAEADLVRDVYDPVRGEAMKPESTTMIAAKKIGVGLVALFCAAALTACEEPDWDNPEYISKRLNEGDSTDRQLALQKVDELDDEKLEQLAPALAKVYMEGGPNQKDAMQYLVQLRVPEAKDAYMKEVKENEAGYAAAAAEALGEAGVKEALPDMIALYTSSDDNDLKQGLLRAFSHMPDPQLVGPLTDTLNLDVDNYPIALHSYSCDILGDIGQATPQAVDEPAKRALVKSLFVGNMAGQTVSKECGLAIQKLGDSAVPILLETFAGKNKAVTNLLLKYNKAPNYQFPANRPKAVTAVRLGALKSQKAVEPFLKDLASTKEAPEQLSGQHAVQWRVTEAQATSEIINALGDIGDKKATEVLAGIVKKEKIEEEWDEITDWQVELQLRQDAAFSLVRLGDRAGADALLEMAKDGVIIDMERLASQLKGDQKMPMLQRYQFNWMMAQAYSYLTDADGLDGLVALIKDTEEAELKKKYESFIPVIKEGGVCLAKGKPAGQAECFDKLLASDNKEVRKKAAYELSRLPAQAAGPVITKHLGHDDLETREIVSFAAYRVPSKGMVDKIDKVLEDEKDKGKQFALDHYRLKLLKAWLNNNVAAVAQK
jgi:HEAT repeat protein